MQNRQSKAILLYTVFNLVLAFYPLISLTSANPYLLSRPMTAEMAFLLVFFGGLFVVTQALYLTSKSERALVLFYLGVVLLFLWEPVLDLTGGEGIIQASLFVAFVLGVLALAFRMTRSRELTNILAFALLAYSLAPLLTLALPEAGHTPGKKDSESPIREQVEALHRASLSPPRNSPNIYLLLFDTMPGTEIYLDHIDGSEISTRAVLEFEERMEALGFVHLRPAWSNYHRTSPSMFSLFNMNYLSEIPIPFSTSFEYFGFVGSALQVYLDGAGYRIVSTGKDVPCPEVFDACFESANPLELISSLASSTPLQYVATRADRYLFTPLGSSLLRQATAALATQKLQEVDDFLAYLEQKQANPEATFPQPEFVYAHFTAAHPVNYYDENCETESIALYEQRSGEDDFHGFEYERFGSEYLCFLKRIASVSESIVAADPNAWILVFSDHGYGVQMYGIEDWESSDHERLDAGFRILNLVKTSPSCNREFSAQRSNVNKSRALVNCLSESADLPYLTDQIDLLRKNSRSRFTIQPDRYE
ncbi:LTA synthase family protein [Myxococcota bacterium]|nr:LTA synthase family protein [Myxococcota bacterium]